MSATCYRFRFRSYSRSFRQPLRTHHGLWTVRQGIILQLKNARGQVGWGEIAPIAWFGTESLEQALAFCRSLPAEITTDTIAHIPATLPACQFGFEAAREMVESIIAESTSESKPSQALPCSHLLPTGATALQSWQTFPASDVQTFKWKIGVAPLEEEIEQFQHLIKALPGRARLRLDANGALSLDDARRWLECCDVLRSSDLAEVEFLEQPLPVNQLNQMQELSQQFSTPIALDESVATFPHLEACYQQGWRGIFVIKAAIAGSPTRLRQFCQHYPIDVVWSSGFETPIARHFIQHYLIPSIAANSSRQRALGFGVNQWFTDSQFDRLDQIDQFDQLGQSEFEQLWCSL